MYFLNNQHENNYRQLMDRVHKMQKDPGYQAAGYILALPELYGKGSAKYFGDDGFDWEKLISGGIDFSSGYLQMLNLASNLFNSIAPFNLGRCLSIIDDELAGVLIQAIKIMRPRGLEIKKMERCRRG